MHAQNERLAHTKRGCIDPLCHPCPPLFARHLRRLMVSCGRPGEHLGERDMRTFTLAEAARLIGTSRSVLYRAIEAGRLHYKSGGGPGKASMVTEDALRQAGYAVPPDIEHLGRVTDVQRTSQATSPDNRRLHDLEQRLGHLERLVGRLEHELDLAVTLLKSLVGQP